MFGKIETFPKEEGEKVINRVIDGKRWKRKKRYRKKIEEKERGKRKRGKECRQ